MKEILNTHEKAFGQAINVQKSEIYFSKNTKQEACDTIVALFGVAKSLGTGKYIGLPSMIDRNKKVVFNYLRDRLWKEIMVKSVAQAIPTYCMRKSFAAHCGRSRLEGLVSPVERIGYPFYN